MASCLKKDYYTKDAAYAALRRLKKEGRPERRVYPCKTCRCFHLTSH